MFTLKITEPVGTHSQSAILQALTVRVRFRPNQKADNFQDGTAETRSQSQFHSTTYVDAPEAEPLQPSRQTRDSPASAQVVQFRDVLRRATLCEGIFYFGFAKSASSPQINGRADQVDHALSAE
jgi:hypothetical protein